MLFTYLQKLGFDEDGASSMIIKHYNNLFGYKGLAWQLGRISLEFFCMYFLQDTFLPKETNAVAPIADVHREIWKDIQDSIIGDGSSQVGRILPRGTGKSAFGTFAADCWCHSFLK